MTDGHDDGKAAKLPPPSVVDFEADPRATALAREIAETIALDEWDETKIAALTADLEYGVQHYLSVPDNSGELHRERLKRQRDTATERAKVFQAAANAVHEEQTRVQQMLWEDPFKKRGYPYPPAPPPTQPTDSYTLRCDLFALAKAERAVAKAASEELRLRRHSEDDALVHWLWQVLARHELPHSGHKDPRSGYMTGNLVNACALIRGDNPVKARWAVKAIERVSQRQSDPLQADSRLGPRRR